MQEAVLRKYLPKNPVFTKYVLCLSPCITSEELNDAQFYRWPFWPFLYDLRRKSAPLPSSKKKDEKIAKIAIIHVACPQTFFFFFVFVVGWLFVCLRFFSSSFQFFWQFDSAQEQAQCARMSATRAKKTPIPLHLRWTNPPRFLFLYARSRTSKI